MEKLKEKLGITGKYRVIVDRADGTREVGEYENTINAELKAIINDILTVSTDFALNALFNGVLTPPTIGEDGIIIWDGTYWYETVCSTTKPTATTTKVTGVFTGVAGTFSNAALGQNHTGDPQVTPENNFSGPVYATPTAWNNVILAVADTLTIEWTIDCAP